MKVAPISLRIAVGVSVALGIGWLILSSRPPVPPPLVGPPVPLNRAIRNILHQSEHRLAPELRRAVAAIRRSHR